TLARYVNPRAIIRVTPSTHAARRRRRPSEQAAAGSSGTDVGRYAPMPMPRPRRPLNFPAPSTIQRYGKPHHRQHALLASGLGGGVHVGPGAVLPAAACGSRQVASPECKDERAAARTSDVSPDADSPARRPLNIPARYGKPHHRQHALLVSWLGGGGVHVGPGASGVQEDEEEEMESVNVDAGGHEDGDTNGEPVLYFDLPEPGPLDPSPGFDVDTSPPRGKAVLRCVRRWEVDDPNEPYSDTDEELMAMDVPEPTKPSPEPSKQSGLYGHYKDKVVLHKLGRESDAGTGFPSLGSQ
ncbi:hypothetical protein THAOC_25714, partial [Thalassiosira oceanica]